MFYIYLLVVVVLMLESQVLIKKVVLIVCFVNVKVSLIIFVMDLELYNQFVVLMMENLCEVMQEEMWEFFNELVCYVDYLIERMIIVCGELGYYIKDFCWLYCVDLVICGNYNYFFFLCVICLVKSIVGSCGVDVLLVFFEKG